ncbi:MAG: hypothetical protein DSO02_05870 [Hadesarchaea archaeon]|nr:MAG: hypothetical protein DSO02_05870 [Hadesarchaea archaeon]TDA32926.1 MAG: hypothetical protein DSO03_01585 [Hadesarchaea archaeon]
MAFWMDPFLLFLCGLAVALVRKKLFFNSRLFTPLLFVLVILLFWVVSIGMFCNLNFLKWAWKGCGAQSGTEWMINGGIFSLVSPGSSFQTLSPEGMFLSIFMFVLYPLYLWLGIRAGERLFKTPLESPS